MKRHFTLRAVLVLFLFVVTAMASGTGDNTGSDAARGLWSVRIGNAYLLRHPDANMSDSGSTNTKWNYEQGLMQWALLRLWQSSGDERYFDFVRRNLDLFVGADGSIRTYKRTDYNLDNIGPGRALLEVYKQTRENKYRFAADSLRRQLMEQPRTQDGGYWHKKIYPHQMWLDGLFMAEPFYATYAAMTGEDSAFDDIVNQFMLIARHTLDSATGLYYHGWDESREQRWANPVTGCSPVFWGRSIGWFAMGLVDVLEVLPATHPQRSELESMVQRLAEALLRFQDPSTGLWYQVVDQGGREGNYLESSASCMFAYFFARGTNRKYLDKKFFAAAEQAFAGITQRQVRADDSGRVDLYNTCAGTGLGGTPYRDGSYQYYVSVPRRTNDLKGLGPFLLAAIELEKGRSSK